MIDLSDLRERPQAYQEAAKKKRIDIDVKAFLKLDEGRRDLLKLVEDMRAQKNSVSKRVPQMKGVEKDIAITKMKDLDRKLKEKEEDLRLVEKDWMHMQLLLPNLPSDRAPVGKDETQNRERKRWGTIPKFDFEPKDHVELGETLDIVDFKRGVKVAGKRGYYLKGVGTLLHLAVIRFALDSLIKKGWLLFESPLIAGERSFVGTGFFPGADQQNIYAVGGKEDMEGPIKDDQLYIIGTSEVTVASHHMDDVLSVDVLPLRYAGQSVCLRREAGSYGKDTKGLYRVHQFYKVEQVVLCEADETKALALFEEIRTNAEEVLQTLKLPYRVIDICTGDMGRGKVFMQDIETWMPSRGVYGETHSCSYLGDFQARRLNIKYTDHDGKKKFVHTLNNTCIASPRILIPILEMYQNADGSVMIPEVLRPYMGGKERIENGKLR